MRPSLFSCGGDLYQIHGKVLTEFYQKDEGRVLYEVGNQGNKVHRVSKTPVGLHSVGPYISW